MMWPSSSTLIPSRLAADESPGTCGSLANNVRFVSAAPAGLPERRGEESHMQSVNRRDDPAYARFGFDAARECAAGQRQIMTSGQVGDPGADMAGQLAGALD